MARGSGSSGGSYRQWAAAERAAEREREQKRKQAEKDRAVAAAAARDDEAAAGTAEIERRVAELESLLRSSLGRDPRVRFESLRISAAVPPLDLGPLANPVPAPQWADFEPARPSALGRMLGGGQRYHASCEEAQRTFADAQADCQRREAARQRGIAAARAEWARAADEAKRRADAHNAHVAETEAGFRARDRFAVSEYVQAVLDRSPYPEGFPPERYAGYVPESSLLAVKWFLPAFDVIPGHKAFRHVKARKAVEPVARPPAEAQRLYTAVIAQVAVRTVREVFTVTPPDMVSTVVFTGHVDTVDPATGQKTQPPLISMRATREKFDELVLTEPRFDPVASIKRHFFAAISQHPEELKPVEPVMPFSRADPRVVEAIDVISALDQRPNLLDLSPEAFESFVQNLFTKMGYDTDQFRSSGDGGIDCMAYKRDPVAPMKIAVQAKLYTKTVSPTHVRDLYGAMQHEGATLGIMITTSGYGPGSVEFANGKPLHLIDGPGLISICQEHDIPARILGLGTRKPKP
ncbi:MAG: restriction endonuclease [Trebonia sp.]